MMHRPLPGADSTADLLLCAVRVLTGLESAQGLRALLHDGIDWAHLVDAAQQHGVMPHLYWSLSRSCPEAVPQAVLAQLRDQFHVNLWRNLRWTGELHSVLDLFDAHGIPAIPLKGPALATFLHGNLALRQFTDLDILVRKHDVLKAKEVLISHGYQPFHKLNQAQEAVFLRTGMEYNFYRQEPRVCLEVHWRMQPWDSSIPLDLEGVWGRCEPLGLAGRTVLHPPVEDLLLILLVHGSRHFWQKLKWIGDVAQLMRVHQDMDWSRVMAGTTTPIGRRMLCPGLLLARELLGAPLPEQVWQNVQQDPQTGRLASRMRQRLFGAARRSLSGWESALWGLHMREGMRDRMAYGLDLLLTPTPADRACMPLPEPLFPLYYVLRPLRLAAKYTWGLARRMAEEKHAG